MSVNLDCIINTIDNACVVGMKDDDIKALRALATEIRHLRVENEVLKADAERYRFLCELNENEPDKFYEFPDACGWSKQEMDKLIDALRGEGE